MSNIVETQALNHVVLFFDQDTINKLTAFELLFEENNIRYLYRLALTKDEIYEESLSYAPNGRMVNLF